MKSDRARQRKNVELRNQVIGNLGLCRNVASGVTEGPAGYALRGGPGLFWAPKGPPYDFF